MVPHAIESFHLRAEGETWALKFARFRKELLASGAKDVPQIYLGVELANLAPAPMGNAGPEETAAIPGLTQKNEIADSNGASVSEIDTAEIAIPFGLALDCIAKLAGLIVKKTNDGYLIDLPQTAKCDEPWPAASSVMGKE